MTKKPSLYVVERKEVVILVVLFVLITVLAFTMGVKYGENVGRKHAQDKQSAEAGLTESPSSAGGHLGAGDAPADPHASAAKPATSPETSGKTDPRARPADPHAGATGAATPDPHAESGHGTPADAAAPALATPSPAPKAPADAPAKTEKGDLADTDEYLLNALREAGIEKSQANAKAGAPVRRSDGEDDENIDEESARPSGDEGEADAPLPEKVKGGKSAHAPTGDYWVIQVASYPSEQEARRHAEKLRTQSLEPLVFSGMDSKNGKWYRVALGKYADKERAGEVARTYKTKGWIGSGSFVRKAP